MRACGDETLAFPPLSPLLIFVLGGHEILINLSLSLSLVLLPSSTPTLTRTHTCTPTHTPLSLSAHILHTHAHPHTCTPPSLASLVSPLLFFSVPCGWGPGSLCGQGDDGCPHGNHSSPHPASTSPLFYLSLLHPTLKCSSMCVLQARPPTCGLLTHR